MYYIVLLLNFVLLAYVVFAFVKPQIALFFVKDTNKRKRVPYSLIVLGAYLVFFFVASGYIENTPERKAEIAEQERIESEKKARAEAEQAAIEWDKEIRRKVGGLNIREQEGRLDDDGPDSKHWRVEQKLLAQRDSLNLVWVENILDNRFSIERGSSEATDIDKYLKIAAYPYWVSKKYSVYYNNPNSLADSLAKADGRELQFLMDKNNKKAIRLNQKFSSKLK